MAGSADIFRDKQRALNDAVPFLESANCYTEPTPVCGVLYIDSTDENFKLNPAQQEALGKMCASFLRSWKEWMNGDPDRIVNILNDRVSNGVKEPSQINCEIAEVFEILEAINPPTAVGPFQFNFDCSDFRATRGR